MHTKNKLVVACIGVTLMVLTACGNSGGSVTGSVKVDGSSTVFPLTALAAEDFQNENSGIQVTVGSSGTGGGFEKFCRGETDANNASRPIKEEEATACKESGVEFVELMVATDALTVVVNKENDWVKCLTVDQLKAMWSADSSVNNWNQIDPSFPDQPLVLFGPGTDSGTFDYFTKEINGEEGASRTDFTPSEDDNVIVQGVSGSLGGLGYFGYTYFEENMDKLNAVQIDGGNGCVFPNTETARNGTYTPLARPLFVYPSVNALIRPEVEAFFQYYVDNNADIAKSALFIPLNNEQEATLKSEFDKLLSVK
jgi:phosphate transport system substrate-binding protein